MQSHSGVSFFPREDPAYSPVQGMSRGDEAFDPSVEVLIEIRVSV